jgi:hypothetical protein
MKLITTFILFICATTLFAQNGLEGIIVEKYYVSNQNDASVNGTGGILTPGSVTYRIYADLLPGYKFQAAFGIPDHELRMATTTSFFNNEDRGDITPTYTKTQASQNTVMLDSWLSAGGACAGNFGILKSEDNGVANVVNTSGVLQNNDAAAGIPLTVQDGLITGSPEDVTVVGIDPEVLMLGADNLVGNLFSMSNGSWAALNGASGPTAANKVLIAQMTTNGIFSFKLNIQIGTPAGGVQQYVAENPAAGQIQLPGLIYSSLSNLSFNLKAFLEGYYTGGGLMNASVDPVLYPSIADTVKVSLASSNPPHNIIASTKCVLNTNGTIQAQFSPGLIGTSAYLVINHRNSLETWSSDPMILSAINNYNFTNAQSKAYGSNMKNLGDGNFAIYSGDISDANTAIIGVQDGIIESQDYLDMENAVSVLLSGRVVQDITGDQLVEAQDYLVEENNVSLIVTVHKP